LLFLFVSGTLKCRRNDSQKPAMRLLKSSLLLRLLVPALLGFIFINTGCKKTEPCEAVITVTDTVGTRMGGVRVVLRQDSVVSTRGVRADIFEEATTAGNGEAYFKVKWEAVLNVEVFYDTLTIRDYIRLEQSETVRKIVVIR
jgi:hypothetical protein